MNTIRTHTVWLWMTLLLFCSLPVIAGPSYQVFDETYDGWSSKPWGATVTTTSPPTTFRGSQAAKVVYTNAMGVFKPVASGSFKTVGYKHLTFAVYNESNADDLWFVAERSDGTLGTYLRVADYADIGSIKQGRWAWVRIPTTHLGLGTDPTLSYFSVANGRANATAYFDDVAFAANSVLFEGINTTNMSYAPGIYRWRLNSSVSAYYSSKVSYYIKVTPQSAWGGIQFQQQIGNLRTTDYGALAIRFRQYKPFPTQRLSVRLTDLDGNVLGLKVDINESYLPETQTLDSGNWYHISIPLSDFGVSSAQVGGAIIQTDTGYLFYIDDVRFVQKMKWMMPDIKQDVGGYKFGAHWLEDYCSSYLKLHTGSDYSDYTDNKGGRSVYASARGFVKQANSQSGGWGYAVIIQHERGLTTSSLHLDQVAVAVGNEVQRGSYLGKTKYLPSGSHLHYGVRLADYDPIVSQVGALPEVSCAINGTTYPAFSDRFINSEDMDW